MVSQGNISGASRLAQTPGVLKPSAAGSQIKHLGQGAEGLATMVAHPEHGVAVRKLYDPRGVSSPEMIARKEEAGRALGDNPHFAKFLGSAQTPQGGQMHFNEYIHGATPEPINKPMLNGVPQQPIFKPEEVKSINTTSAQAQSALRGAGYSGGGEDIHGLNMKYDPQKKMHRVIDYVPAHQGEFVHDPSVGSNVLSPTNQGARLFNMDNEGTNSTAPGMLNRLLGKGGKPGGVRATDANATGFQRPNQQLPPLSEPTPPPTVSPPINATPPPSTAIQKPQTPEVQKTIVQRPKPPESQSTVVQRPKPVAPLEPSQP